MINRLPGWTTKDEAEALVKAGLDPNTADMCYTNHYFGDFMSYLRVESTPPDEYRSLLDRFLVHAIVEPCWSLGKLISMIPTEFQENTLELTGEPNNELTGREWYVSLTTDNHSAFSYVEDDCPIAAIVKLIIKRNMFNKN